MTLETRAATIEAARRLAVPTIRTILRKRRNAIRHRKPLILAELNADLILAVDAALSLGVESWAIADGTTQHPDDSRVLTAIVCRAALALRGTV